MSSSPPTVGHMLYDLNPTNGDPGGRSELVHVDPEGGHHLLSDRHDPKNPLADLTY